MKGLKKLLTGILAGAMALSMTLTAGTAMTAKAEGGSIKIENAKAGQEYNAYRVFDYVAANSDNMIAGGVYKLSSNFKGLATADGMNTYFTVGDSGILDASGITDDNVADFGKAVIAYAKANNISADVTQKPEKDGDIVINVDYGYYVLDTTLGSAVAVNTTTPQAVIAEKNDVPDLDKKITGSTYEVIEVATDHNNAQIGDEVTFTITADLKKNGEGYKIVDTMTEGLTLKDDSFEISFSNGEVAHNAPEPKNGGFEIVFTGVPTADTTCTVVYKATINENAKIATNENINEAYLVYGNNTETTHKQTYTKTYPIQLKKLITGTNTILAGAEFKVYRKAGNEKVLFTKVSDTEYRVDPNGTVETIVSVDTTPVTLNGFDAETYVFVETKAPNGYNLIVAKDVAPFAIPGGETTTHFQEVTVTESATVAEPAMAIVYNSTGAVLPSTGGIGTTIFYIIGGLLIVAAVVFFVVRRKNDAE